MGIAKVFLAGVEKRAYKIKVTKELERGIDIGELHFSATVFPHQNDKVLVLLDAIDLTNLRGMWHFENNAKDESGLGNHLTEVGGVTYEAGKYGKGYRSKNNDACGIDDNPQLNLDGKNTFSVAFWAESFNSAQGFVRFVSKGYATGGFEILISEAGRIRFAMVNQSASFIQTSTGTFNADGKKHFVVCTYNGTRAKLYFDNQLKADFSRTGNIIDSGHPFVIGSYWASWPGAGFGLDGIIDSVRYYVGHELTANEISRLYKLKNHTSTIKFGGHIWKIDDSITPRICHAKSFGKQIGETTVVQKVYNNQTVDFMVQDLMQTNTGLTFVKGPSTQVSPSIVQFVAKGYLIDLVKTLAGQANKTFFTDGLAQFHWDDNDATQIPVTYTHGAGAILIDSGKDDTQLVNKVTVKGQDVLYQTKEQFTGDGVTTAFITSFIITNPLVTVDGVVKIAEQDYTINTQNKTLTFLTAPANAAAIVVQYTYDSPITIQSIDQDSIDKNGIRGKEVPAPWITTIGDATRFGQFYVQAFKDVKQRVTVKIPGIDVQIDSNQIVALVNSIKNINGAFTIKSVTWEYPGITTLDCGEFTFEQFELHKQVVSALHNLQALMSINTQIINFKNLRETLGITDTVTRKLLQRGKYNSNTFYSNTQVYR